MTAIKRKKIILNFCFILNILNIFTSKLVVNGFNDPDNIKLITRHEQYEPVWDSLDSRPLPDWYDDGKIGIFIHWGVYSVPSMGTEWFWTNWRNDRNTKYIDYMKENFRPGFTYQEFASSFTAEHFDPNEWAQLFEQSGARYVVLTSKHHDGYALWPSNYSYSWNSVDVGPHRDIIDELSNAIQMYTKLRFGLYHSLFEWFHPLYNLDKSNKFLTQEFVNKKIIPEMKELVEKYKPEIFWSDGEWEASSDYWNSTKFLAWLYNESPVKDTVVTNDRWGSETLCKHGGYYTCKDRFNPGTLQSHKWENAMTIDKLSWGQRDNAKLTDFLTSKELIDNLIQTVSCGGNILINVGPTKFGTIEPIFVERLRDLGDWLRINGKGIYATVPWIYQNDTGTDGVWYTSSKDPSNRQTIYAIILNYPYDSNEILLSSLDGYYDNDTTVRMLGYPSEKLKWTITDKNAMKITFPDKRLIDKNGLKFAWTLEIDIKISSLN